uniref:Vasopressin-like preprohormone n=1 Tax=Rhynchophorus ferrugineus TaxID=354439 RepID=A0A5Q0TXJ3_RHYFE|nr:vasopressin-like preprohormone [Rhynchophorus ferrugineus]
MAIFKNSKIIINFLVLVVFVNVIVTGCLITNCPRGGKRSGKFPLIERSNVKQCISCGPGNSGKCFGPSICCGPFGCLMGTPQTVGKTLADVHWTEFAVAKVPTLQPYQNNHNKLISINILLQNPAIWTNNAPWTRRMPTSYL